jgi:hypothetical protein
MPLLYQLITYFGKIFFFACRRTAFIPPASWRVFSRDFYKGLKQIGSKLNFDVQMTITGISTLTDVQNAHTHLAKGNLPFSEIMKPFQLN